MAKYELAFLARVNGNAYRDYLTKHPEAETITLTRPQMEVIIRDLCAYSDRDAEATAWAEQATTNAARIHILEVAIEDAVDAWLGGITAELEAPMRALMAIIQPQVDAAERNAAANAVISRPTPSGAAMGASRGDSVSVHTSGAYRATDEEEG